MYDLCKMKLFSQILGEGSPLLVIHGVFGMSDNWQTLGRKWSEHYQVHLLDMRNHGRSPHSADHNYELMSDDLLEYCEEHQLGQVYLLGHSMGGKVAMHFATYYPERVAKMIVADIAPKAYPPHHQDVLEAMHALDLNQISSRKEAQEQFGPKLHPGVRQFLLKNLYWETKERLNWRFNLKVLSDKIEEIGGALAPNAYYDGPVLFLRGGDSWYIKDADQDLIQQHFPEASLKTVADAGHWLHAQQPQAVFNAVVNFLGE